MWRLLILIALAGCAPADEDSVRTVAAIEVVLNEPQDRTDLLAVLRQHAAESGLHVDDVSVQWREFEQAAAQIAPADQVTFNVGVWRGEDDDEMAASADDRFHPGRVWVDFSRGADPNDFKSYRDATLRAIQHRWPEARLLPVLPSGGLPHARDLVSTPNGYRISRSAAADYDLSPSLPIFVEE